MKVVLNSTPLIYLTKIGKLLLLKKLFGEIIIPKEVFKEVVIKGKREGFSDALIIEEELRKGWIKVKDVEKDKRLMRFTPELDIGEVEVITLARKIKPAIVLIDDACGRAVAESFELNVKGTIYVLLKAYKNKLLSNKEIIELIDKLIFAGFRIAPEVYVNMLKEIK
ncbi:MAG: DUF3368 domain-containing protein [Candidatus Thermoplasmatota archaeon]